MAHIVYCRDCGRVHDTIGGEIPTHCVQCGQAGYWSTEPVKSLDERYPFTEHDLHVLKINRISPDTAEEIHQIYGEDAEKWWRMNRKIKKPKRD